MCTSTRSFASCLTFSKNNYSTEDLTNQKCHTYKKQKVFGMFHNMLGIPNYTTS